MSEVMGFFTRHAMVALLLAVGLATGPEVLRSVWSRRATIGRALFILEIGIPLLALAVVGLFPVRPKVFELLVLLAICPGAPAILRKRNRGPEVIALVVLSSLLVPLSTTAWLAVLHKVLPFQLDAAPQQLTKLMVLQLLPLVLGMFYAALWPRSAAVLSRGLWSFFRVGFGLVLVGAVTKGGARVLETTPWELGALASIVLGSMALGDWAGRPDPDQRRALRDVAALGNPALAMALVSVSYPGATPGALVAAFVILRALILILATSAVQAARAHSADGTVLGPR